MIYRIGNRVVVKLCDGLERGFQHERAVSAIASYARLHAVSLCGPVEYSGSACGWDIFNQRVAA
jgi:hypothetical protein